MDLYDFSFLDTTYVTFDCPVGEGDALVEVSTYVLHGELDWDHIQVIYKGVDVTMLMTTEQNDQIEAHWLQNAPSILRAGGGDD